MLLLFGVTALLVVFVAGSARGGASSGTGPVDVLYAGSLTTVLDTAIDPGFERTTGDTVEGEPGGSSALANQIVGRTTAADVFISASPGVNDSLRGPVNGGWESWDAVFATSRLLIAYNPSSSFAGQLRSKPWYDVVTQPGFILGRTDPATDPKGRLAVEALRAAAQRQKLPALAAAARSNAHVLPEASLVGRLQSGQLDAGFFYASEAVPAGLPTVPLGPVRLHATYTITVLQHAPHQARAERFVSYLLGPRGRHILRRNGFALTRPPIVRDRSSVPNTLDRVLALP